MKPFPSLEIDNSIYFYQKHSLTFYDPSLRHVRKVLLGFFKQAPCNQSRMDFFPQNLDKEGSSPLTAY